MSIVGPSSTRAPAEELRAERRVVRRRLLMRAYRLHVPLGERLRRAWASILRRKPSPGRIRFNPNS